MIKNLQLFLIDEKPGTPKFTYVHVTTAIRKSAFNLKEDQHNCNDIIVF